MADVLLECKSLSETFRKWHVEQDSLDAQLAESLSALSAFQSHLDAWQQQLAREREELKKSREQLDRDRAAAEANQASQAQSSAEVTVELKAARETISRLNADLLARTEELGTLDQRRTEVLGELELARAKEHELKAAIEEEKQVLENEREHWAEEARHLRALLERSEDPAASAEPGEEAAARPSKADPQAPDGKQGERQGESPVLGSILEQFGKLRQQRALDRQALKKTR